MKNFLHELYNGQVPKCNMKATKVSSEEDALWNKIKNERQHFAFVLSAEDFERFKDLEKLHKASHAIRDRRICADAFRLGAMHICAIFMGEETEE